MVVPGAEPHLEPQAANGDRLATSTLLKSRDDLQKNGILRVDMARYLWRKVLDRPTVEENDRIVTGLYRVLLKLGVILPLGHKTFSSIEWYIDKVPIMDEFTPQDVLVVMRLPVNIDNSTKESLQARVKALEGSPEVVLKWRFGSAGAPFGFVERLIVSCYRFGETEMDLCWRFGALFKSHVIVHKDKRVDPLYGFMIRYDVLDSSKEAGGATNCVLSLRMFGPLEDERVWVVLRYVASAMVNMAEEWPGVTWQGWSECPIHRTDVMYLATLQEVKQSGRKYAYRFSVPISKQSTCRV